MPKQIVLTLITLFISLFLLATPIVAATLTLSSIGSVDTAGNRYSAWWYTNTNPTLAGTADPNATVTITIDSVAQSTTANASGAWSYKPTTLTAGDHQVSIASGADTYAFTLHIGSELSSEVETSTTSATPSDLPVSGVAEVTLGLLALGAILVVASVKLFRFNA